MNENGEKDYVRKARDIPLLIGPVADPGADARSLLGPQTLNGGVTITCPLVSLQGYNGLIVQLSFTYGSATGLRFDFADVDPDFPAGSFLYKHDVASKTGDAYGPVDVSYKSLASGSFRIFFPISGNNIQMTITALGTANASDTITKLRATPAVMI